MLVKTKQNKLKKSLFKTITREKSKEKQRQGSILKTLKMAQALCRQSEGPEESWAKSKVGFLAKLT